jgi:hypothetical protein
MYRRNGGEGSLCIPEFEMPLGGFPFPSELFSHQLSIISLCAFRAGSLARASGAEGLPNIKAKSYENI